MDIGRSINHQQLPSRAFHYPGWNPESTLIPEEFLSLSANK